MTPEGQSRMFAPPQGFVRLRLDLEWNGRDFVGWQSQTSGRSVQDTLYAALTQLADARRPVAAGRTDAGVHALAMPVHADVREGSLRLPPAQLARALNALLARDLAVQQAALAPPGFHARFSCRARSYLYRVRQAPQRSPLEEGRALQIARPLDVGAMRAAAATLLGRHDFAAFATQEERDTVRELLALDLVELGPLLELRVTGESFLRHMVRALVGTLLLVGEGKRAPHDVAEILASADRRVAGPNVPPYGLYFAGAEYGG